MTSIKDVIYGFVVGDCYGLSIQQQNYNSLKLKRNKILNIDKGNYSALSTFMFAFMDSLAKNKEVVSRDFLTKMCTSLIVGKYTNNGKIYLVDNYTYKILEHYSKKENIEGLDLDCSFSAYSLSRIVPFALYSYYKDSYDFSLFLEVITVTNTNKRVILSAYIYYRYLINLLDSCDKKKSLNIDIPNYFEEDKILFKKLLKGKINKNTLIFDDDMFSVLNIVFYVILNTNSFEEILYVINNFEGPKYLYLSYCCALGGALYKKESIPDNLIKDLKNKRDINRYINDFERIFL